MRFHPGRREVEADGTFNLRAGMLEFLACAPGHKSHETLVSLECDPEHLKAGLLLMGLEEGRRPESEVDLGPLSGKRVIIELRWTERDAEGRERTILRRAEDCILNGLVAETMEPVGWVSTGSMFIEEILPPPMPGEGEEDDASTSAPAGGAEPGAQGVPGGPGAASGISPGAAAPGSGSGAGGGASGATGSPAAPGVTGEPGADRADPGGVSGGGGQGPGVDLDGRPPGTRTRTVFAAQATGQYISVCHRPFALLDSPLALPYPDADYHAYPDALPPLDRDNPTQVTLVFRHPRAGEIDTTITRMRIPPPPVPEPGAGEDKDGPGGRASGAAGGGDQQ